MRAFAPVPANGMFTTSRPKVIEQCVKAHQAAKHGAFIGIRGYPCVITKVEFVQERGQELQATIHYRRIKDRRARGPREMTLG